MFIYIGIELPSYNLSEHFDMNTFPQVQIFLKCMGDAGLSSRSSSPAFVRALYAGRDPLRSGNREINRLYALQKSDP
jgi:hypothetical protein